jgi:plasmid stabilization system protein ParE
MIAAAVWYEARQAHLGRRFLAAVEDAFNRIQVNPELHRVIEADMRRCVARPFPYGVVFRKDEDQIVVIAVMHMHREPGYWVDRV